MPKVSILLPTYNGGKFLADQLDSILVQSFSDFELLIVDDASVDDTVAVNEDYARRDRRIRIIPSQENLGQKLRLLQLVQEARAPLVSIADQDDIWHPDRVEHLFNGLADYSMSYGRSELVDGAGNPMGQTLIGFLGPEPLSGDRLALLFTPRVSGHAMLVRREIVTEMAFRRFSPYDQLITVDAAFAGGLTYVDDAIVRHRIHGGNQSNARMGKHATRLQRMRPGQLYLQLRSVVQDRAEFVSLLEHLANSPVIASSVRRPLEQAALRCRSNWFVPGTGRPFSDPSLARYVLERLQPFAGSDADWAVSVEHVDRLTRSACHPRSLAHAASAILG